MTGLKPSFKPYLKPKPTHFESQFRAKVGFSAFRRSSQEVCDSKAELKPLRLLFASIPLLFFFWE